MKNPMDRQLEKRLSIAPSPSAAMAKPRPSANYCLAALIVSQRAPASGISPG